MRCGSPIGLWSWAHSAHCLSCRAGMLSWVYPNVLGNWQPLARSAGLATAGQTPMRGSESDPPGHTLSLPFWNETTLFPDDAALSTVCTPPLPSPRMAVPGTQPCPPTRPGWKSLEGRASLRDALWKHCMGTTRTCNATTMHHSCPLGGCGRSARGVCAREGWGPPPKLAYRSLGGHASHLEQI